MPAMGGRAAYVGIVTCGLLDGRPIVISEGYNDMVRVWDLASHRQIGPSLTCEEGHDPWSIAYGQIDGRPVAVKGQGDLIIWELTGHAHAEQPSAPRYIRYNAPGSIYALACTMLYGRSVAVTGSYDCTVRMWDLAVGTQIGEPLHGHGSVVRSVAAGMLAGRAIAVSSSEDHTIRVWDLNAGQAIGGPLTGHTDEVWAVDIGMLDGRPIAVSGGDDDTVRVWHLPTGQQVGPPLTGHTGRVRAVAFGAPDGRPIAVSGSEDYSIRVWDLRTGRQIGLPMEDDRTIGIRSIAYTLLGGRPRVVAADGMGRARVWNLDAHHAMGMTRPTQIAPVLPDMWTDPDTGDVYDLTGPIVDDDGREWDYIDWDGFEPLLVEDGDLALGIVQVHQQWGLRSIITSASGRQHGRDDEDDWTE
ncbi:hypothetical protein GCM10017600_75060 [Streptosporangium carneum]|uniref:WD40 repeat domain-containing protein n=2 Tax=Streptosporangium carneum TaxID=47481 RepID=A0A9W6MGS4_9ACTN|nr:hypothetical protein GCM10017600_75060 [Streptosporangium carneum]